jgi:hypothetical protein
VGYESRAQHGFSPKSIAIRAGRGCVRIELSIGFFPLIRRSLRTVILSVVIRFAKNRITQSKNPCLRIMRRSAKAFRPPLQCAS